MSAAADAAPGEVTLLFTDVEGSTRLLARLGDRYIDALGAQRHIVRTALAEHGGLEVDALGDAFFAVFDEADDAVRTAIRIHRELLAHPWPDGVALRVRIGLHTGRPSRYAEGLVGMDVHRAARIAACGHGGQTVLSDQTRRRCRRIAGVGVRPAGVHRLKDLPEPLELYDLDVDGLPNQFPPLISARLHPTDLPMDLPRLLGRDQHLDEVTRLIAGGHRLVTVTGPGGIGKTSLACHAVRALVPAFPDGASAVWLATLVDHGQVLGAIAAALDVRHRPDRPLAQVLESYLEDRKLLLYLDNFEHVLEASQTLERLLRMTRSLQVIVTSRIPLRIPGERELALPPLATHTAERDLPPAAQLFLERAAQARPSLVVDTETQSCAVAIARGLDGLPLAIELVAARARIMHPSAILDRVAHPLDLASGGASHLPDRHQTLRATMEWSHRLVDEGGQRLFARLGVFASPFTVEAAEQVCHAGLDELGSLVDHGLLRAVDDDGRGRLGMLETLRAFAVEKLAAGPEESVLRERHAAWCEEFASVGGPELVPMSHERWLPRYDAEQEDLRAALRWLNDSGQAERALAFVADLSVFWDTRAQWHEGRAALEAALATADEMRCGRPADRARVLFMIGRFAAQQGSPRAADALHEALTLFREAGDVRGISLTTSHVGWAAYNETGDLAVAERWDRESLEVACSAHDPWSIAAAQNNLASTIMQTDPSRAVALLEDSVRGRRALGERRTLAVSLKNLAEALHLAGRGAEARRPMDEGLSLALEIGLEWIAFDAVRVLGEMAFAEGRLDEARALLTDAVERADRAGEVFVRAVGLRALSRVEEARGDVGAARVAGDALDRLRLLHPGLMNDLGA